MMGQQTRNEALFYYFRLEDEIPEDHLLRLIDRHVDLSFVRERVKGLYSSTGRPSIDPEVLLRLLLIGYLYGITSERRRLRRLWNVAEQFLLAATAQNLKRLVRFLAQSAKSEFVSA